MLLGELRDMRDYLLVALVLVVLSVGFLNPTEFLSVKRLNPIVLADSTKTVCRMEDKKLVAVTNRLVVVLEPLQRFCFVFFLQLGPLRLWLFLVFFFTPSPLTTASSSSSSSSDSLL
jgi:hypothetical protein